MGDRVSIQFGKHWPDGQEWLSAVLCHHWGGTELHNRALKFIDQVKAVPTGGISTPLTRLDPDHVMVMFVSLITLERGVSSLRLVPTYKDCDNSDNGHYIVWLDDPDNITVTHHE